MPKADTNEDGSIQVWIYKSDRDRLKKIAALEVRGVRDQFRVLLNEVCDRRCLDSVTVEPVTEEQT